MKLNKSDEANSNKKLSKCLRLNRSKKLKLITNQITSYLLPLKNINKPPARCLCVCDKQQMIAMMSVALHWEDLWPGKLTSHDKSGNVMPDVVTHKHTTQLIPHTKTDAWRGREHSQNTQVRKFHCYSYTIYIIWRKHTTHTSCCVPVNTTHIHTRYQWSEEPILGVSLNSFLI